MITLETLNDAREYARLHELVFNQPPPIIPAVVTVGRNDRGDIVGFVSGFWNSDDGFYIQWVGLLPEYQRSGYLRYYRLLLSDSVTYDTAVRNTNIVALKTTLSIGFIPIGVIQQDNKLYVQLKREKHG